VGTAASEGRGMQECGKQLSDAEENYTNRVKKPADGDICIYRKTSEMLTSS